jgi:hypothetical protein
MFGVGDANVEPAVRLQAAAAITKPKQSARTNLYVSVKIMQYTCLAARLSLSTSGPNFAVPPTSFSLAESRFPDPATDTTS